MNWTDDYRRGPDTKAIASAIAVATVVAIFGVLFVRAVKNARPPADAAREFAASLGFEDARVSCADMDTDGDGYVSCAVRAGGSDKLIAVECTVLGSWCRIATGKPSGRIR